MPSKRPITRHISTFNLSDGIQNNILLSTPLLQHSQHTDKLPQIYYTYPIFKDKLLQNRNIEEIGLINKEFIFGYLSANLCCYLCSLHLIQLMHLMCLYYNLYVAYYRALSLSLYTLEVILPSTLDYTHILAQVLTTCTLRNLFGIGK